MQDTSRSKQHPKHRFPGYYLPHVEQFVCDRGGDGEALYFKSGIDKASFAPPQDFVNEEQFNAFIEEAIVQSGEPAFGFEIGKQFSIASFGLLSRAVMSCADIRSMMTLVERYSTLAMPVVRCVCHDEDKFVVLELLTTSRYASLNRIIMEAMLSNLNTVFSMLTGRPFDIEKICVAFDEPNYDKDYFEGTAKSIEFNCVSNLLFIEKKLTNLPLFTANPTDAKYTLEQCEAELLKNRETSSLSGQVSDQIRFYLDTGPSSAEISAKLNMTERTMRRKLSEEGVNYRELLQQIRQEMACYYLGETELQIAQIALKLGYQETSNFRSAFKKWQGKSPRAWREEFGLNRAPNRFLF